MDDDDVRDVVRKKEGTLRGVGTPKRRLLMASVAVTRARALLVRDAAGNALSSTQREELYSGLRREHTDGPVTGVLTVVKRPGQHVSHGKLKNDQMLPSQIFEMKPWNESARFPRRRFNPDTIRPLFTSEAAYRQARAAQG